MKKLKFNQLVMVQDECGDGLWKEKCRVDRCSGSVVWLREDGTDETDEDAIFTLPRKLVFELTDAGRVAAIRSLADDVEFLTKEIADIEAKIEKTLGQMLELHSQIKPKSRKPKPRARK